MMDKDKLRIKSRKKDKSGRTVTVREQWKQLRRLSTPKFDGIKQHGSWKAVSKPIVSYS